eukprot:SM000018S03739  [mRNA]  locus=s18:1082485:1084302:- [translate_table: standard]
MAPGGAVARKEPVAAAAAGDGRRGARPGPPPLVFRTHADGRNGTAEAWIARVLEEASTRRKLYDALTIRRWVEGHNKEREKHYQDAPLVWDKAVARYAQAHGGSVQNNANCAPEFNEDNDKYGENLYWAVYEHGQDPWSVQETVREWVQQGRNYDHEENRCEEGEDCAAYLQVVWRNTKMVGCGEVYCPYHGDFKGVAQFFVCNYYPPALIEPGHPRPY